MCAAASWFDSVGFDVGAENVRQILRLDHLREIPAQRPVRPREIADIREEIHLVHHDQELVRDAGKRLRKDRQALARGARLVRIEEKDDEIGVFGKMPDDGGEIVSARAWWG